MLKPFTMTLISVILLLGMLLGSSWTTTGGAQEPEFVPIIFVHGGAGSGAQYQSQAMRFASNGYPADHIRVFDYDSSNPSPDIVQPALDGFIDSVLAELDADQAYMLGHSLGTSVMQEYLNSSPERAARVAKYINIDGRTADSPPGGVPTLAIWGMGSPEREIVGAENVYFPDQTHTESVTSPESFAAQYEFFTGEPPATTDIEPQADVQLAGRAVLFPQNVGIEGATLEIWEVDDLTGARTGSQPEATYSLGADGTWGPFAADATQHYEMVLIREEGAHDHHLYSQPFMRSNYLIRLLSVSPDSPIVENAEGSERHSVATIIRYKEWWGDDPGGNNDTLEINGTNVINAATSPISNRTIGIHAFDKGSDGVTDLSEPDGFFFALPFQTGTDIFMPAAPPEGTICFANAPRGDESHMQVLNVPNWPSSEHRISIEFTDYVREGDPECGDIPAAAPVPPPIEPAPAPEAAPVIAPAPAIAPSTGSGGLLSEEDGGIATWWYALAAIGALLVVAGLARARSQR